MKTNRIPIFLLFILTVAFLSCSDDNSPGGKSSNNNGGNNNIGGCAGGPTTLTDIDGNVYNVVSIGNQCWMQENLKVTRYRNGDSILTGLNEATWTTTDNGAFFFHDSSLYGNLYNWFAVNDSRGLCPLGWHVPSDEEWSTFINYFEPNANGGNNSNYAGFIMKSTTGWISPNWASNGIGFKGLPGGSIGGYGWLSSLGPGSDGFWWSSTEYDSENAWLRSLVYDGFDVGRYFWGKREGNSIRCVRDSDSSSFPA